MSINSSNSSGNPTITQPSQVQKGESQNVELTSDKRGRVTQVPPIHTSGSRRDRIGKNIAISRRKTEEYVHDIDNISMLDKNISPRSLSYYTIETLYGNTDSSLTVLDTIKSLEAKAQATKSDHNAALLLKHIANEIIKDIKKKSSDEVIVKDYIEQMVLITKVSKTIKNHLREANVLKKVVSRIQKTKFGYNIDGLKTGLYQVEKPKDSTINDFVNIFTTEKDSSKNILKFIKFFTTKKDSDSSENTLKYVNKINKCFDKANKEKFDKTRKDLQQDQEKILRTKCILYNQGEELINELNTNFEQQIRKKSRFRFIQMRNENMRLAKLNRKQLKALSTVKEMDKTLVEFYKKNKRGKLDSIAIDKSHQLTSTRQKFLFNAGFRYIEDLLNNIGKDIASTTEIPINIENSIDILRNKVLDYVSHTEQSSFTDAVFLASVRSATAQIKADLKSNPTPNTTDLADIIDTHLKQKASIYQASEFGKQLDFYIVGGKQKERYMDIDKLLRLSQAQEELDNYLNSNLSENLEENICLIKSMYNRKKNLSNAKNKNKVENLILNTSKSIIGKINDSIEKGNTEKALDNILSILEECQKGEIAIGEDTIQIIVNKINNHLESTKNPDMKKIIEIYKFFDPSKSTIKILKKSSRIPSFLRNNSRVFKEARESLNDSILKCLISHTDINRQDEQFARFTHLTKMLNILKDSDIKIKDKDNKLVEEIVQYHENMIILIKKEAPHLLYGFCERIEKKYHDGILKEMLEISLFDKKNSEKSQYEIYDLCENIYNNAIETKNKIKPS